MAKVHDEMAATTIGTMDADPEAGEHGGEHGGGLGISQESLKMTRWKKMKEEMHFSEMIEMMWFLPKRFIACFLVLFFWFLHGGWETISPRKPCACSSFTPISFKRGPAFKKAESWSEPWRACESTSIPVWHFGSKRWDEKNECGGIIVIICIHMSCKYSTPGNSAEQVACSAVSTRRCGVEGLSKAWLCRSPTKDSSLPRDASASC